jgi:hypothetical protein
MLSRSDSAAALTMTIILLRLRHRTVFRFKAIEDLVGRLYAPRIDVCDPTSERRVKSGQARLALLDEANTFPKHLALRIVSARLHKLRNKGLELTAEINAKWHRSNSLDSIIARPNNVYQP